MRPVLLVLLVACGGSQKKPPPTNDIDPPGVVQDTRTPIQKRRDAACDALGPKLVQCAVDDAKRDLATGKITQKQFDADTAPKWRDGLRADWDKKCKVDMSSRQVRVLEVCFHEEQECAPLVDCLHHIDDNVGK
jgi:hypothetical protein